MFRGLFDKNDLRLPLATCLIALGALWSIPLFLLRVEMPGNPQPTPVVDQRPPVIALGGALVFRDPAAQSREFIGYYHTIEITAEQEAIKKEVLGAMPAACCSAAAAGCRKTNWACNSRRYS